MGRILFWVVLGFVAYVAWRWWNVKQRLSARSSDQQARNPLADETMVPCAACGLNVPKSEAFAGNGRWYCSDDHRRRGPA